MFAWITSFFKSADRTQVAGERIAKAAEDMAEMMEQARDQFKARLGLEPAAVEVKALPAEPEKEKRGRSR